jgi:hypothetical protein
MVRYLIPLLLSFNLYAVEVTTDNLLSNSTFGTGTTYSDTGWTITGYDSSHNYTSSAGGNDPGGAMASGQDTSITQTVDSLASAAEMTVPEIQKGWSSTMSTDIWYWNQYNNTTTLKQTITDSAGNVTVQQRVISDTGCGSINCGQYTNYTDKHIQGSNTNTDFSIGVNVSNSNSRSGHYGPDIDDIQLKVTYTDVPPIDTSTQEIIDDIEEDIEFEEEFTWEEDIALEENFYFEEEEITWEENFYFEEEFNMEEYMTMDFEDQWVEMEDMEFEEDWAEFDMEPEMVFEDEFMETAMVMTEFDDMYMENFEEFEEFEDAWEMEPEMTEMDTFFTEMSDEEWEEFEEMSEDEFTEFLEEEFPEEFVEMQEEMEETPVEEEMVFEEEEAVMTEEPEEMEESEETVENEPTETEVANEESTEETTDDVETESKSEESTQEVAENESKPDAKEDKSSTKISTAKLKEEKIKTKSVAKIDVTKIKEIIVEEVKIDLFSNQETLQEYSQVSFYQPEQIYTDVDTSFFDQINMIEYNKEIYQNVRLASYIDNDPVEVHRKNMERINMEKQRLLIELQQLKGQ